MCLGNAFSVDVMTHGLELKFITAQWRLKASHYFIRELNTTNFSEHNKIQTE